MSLDDLGRKLAAQEAAGLRRRLRTFTAPQKPRTEVEGRPLLLLASNAYLGLNTHPAVVGAAQAAAAAFGTGSGGSRLVCGTSTLHRELEAALAALKSTEDAVLFGTGYQANVGVLTALAGPRDLILSDELNHASLIDGCRLSGARFLVYRHGDPDHVAALLAAERHRHRRCFIVTDGVFSMDGDVAPLPALADAADRHGAILVVDDAHATGVLGPGGAGTAAHFGLTGRVPVQVGTLSKALGSEGGFVAGSHVLCEYLRNRARPFLFSTAPAPPSVAAALAALRVVEAEPGRRERLLALAARLRGALRDLGFRVPAGETPIIPVVVGDVNRAVDLASVLEEEGVYCPAIRPPSVPPGTSRLRVTVMATHTEEDLDAAAEAFARAGRRVGVIP